MSPEWMRRPERVTTIINGEGVFQRQPALAAVSAFSHLHYPSFTGETQ
jgi:hypothetical protein